MKKVSNITFLLIKNEYEINPINQVSLHKTHKIAYTINFSSFLLQLCIHSLQLQFIFPSCYL